MSSSREHPPRWAAIGPAALLEVLAPLRDEHLRQGEVWLIARDAERPLHEVAAELHGDGTTLLVLEDPAQPSLRGTCATPFMTNADGADVALGWLRLDAQELSAYSHRAAALLQRESQPRLPIALLGPREDRYIDLLDQLALAAESASELVAFQWNAERLARHRLADALRQGAAAAIYAGHGSARGWFAYGGIRADMLTGESGLSADQSIAVLFSLSCRTGQPAAPIEGNSTPLARGLADEIVAGGVAAAVVAPLEDPLHDANRVLATALVNALASGTRRCADILYAARRDGACVDGYAIIGDPATRVAAAPDATERCAHVFAPAPDAILTRPS